MHNQIFVDADYVRGKENTNILEGTVQPMIKRGGALRNPERNGKKGEFPFPAAYTSTQYREIINF